MVRIDFDQFDDELQSLLGLRDEGKIALNDDALQIPIKMLYLKKAIAVKIGTSLKDAIDTLLARNIGSILVLDGKDLCGILSERDLLWKVAGQELDIGTEKIDNFMSTNPAKLQDTDTVEDALRCMDENGYRHIPVVDETGAAVNLISIKDIIGYLVEFFPNDILNLPPHPVRRAIKERFGA